MQMAAGESGAPGNAGNGVRHSKGTAKKLREVSAAKLPLPFEEGQRAQGGCRDDEGCPGGCQRAAGWAQSRWHSQAGREPVQTENRALQGQRRTHRLLLTAALPEGIYRGGGGPSRTDFNPLFDLAV